MERPGLLNEGTERIEFSSGMVIHTILLITNTLCVFMGIHGLFWVGGFTVLRMLCHLDAAFCVECVWNGTDFLSLFSAGLKPGLHLADSSMAFVQNLAGCLPISRSEWWQRIILPNFLDLCSFRLALGNAP